MDQTAINDIHSEAWFLAQIEQNPIPLAALAQALERLRSEGAAEAAESRAEILQDTLAERKLFDESLQVMELRASWVTGKTGVAATWQQEAQDILGNTWETKALIEGSLSDRIISARESIRRLRLLRSLKDGSFVYDRTWGMGVVTRVDLFNKKVEVDFERKLGHTLSLAYAAETLQAIGEDHLLVWKKHRADALRDLVEKNPAEVIRMYLRSFGPAPIAQIQQTLTSGVVSPADWKRFWDAARKELKKSGQVAIPAARGENLRLVETSPEAASSGGLADFGRERDLTTIVERLETVAEQKAPLSDADRRILADRLAYALHGATSKQVGIRARALIADGRLRLLPEAQSAAAREQYFKSELFLPTIRQLSARASRAFLRYLAEGNPDRLHQLLIALLPQMDVGTLNEAVTFLIENGQENGVAGVYQTALSRRNAGVEILSWLSRNMERIDAWSLGAYAPWVMMMIDELEQDYSGDRLKAQNQIRERFAKADWLKFVMANLDNQQRRNLLGRVKESAGWDTLDKQLVMAHMVKLYPALEDVLTAKADAKDAPAPRPLLTSRRSYRERQLQLQKIIQVELPQVARDIGIARSYGDLRENHEFKSAKEHQLVLMRKRDELDDMLRRVAPTDFAGFPTDAVGPATSVTLEYENGRRETYYVLGEWDGDTSLGIISSSSRMAQVLAGRRAGESVTVPTETGETSCRVASVEGLPESIVQWINTEPTA